MINLQPYGNPQYFVWLFISFLPLMIGLYHGRRFQCYETIVSLPFISLMFTGAKYQQGIAIIIYILWQLALVTGYAHYRRRNNRTVYFYLAVLLSSLPLIIVKVTPAIAGGQPSLIGFLGISYLTFKAVQTLMELRDGVLKDYSPKLFLHFLLFFPTLSSGPIDRYRRFAKDYATVPTKAAYLDFLEQGVHQILLGFFYKFILGYLFGTIWLPQLAHAALHNQAITHGLGLSWALVGYMYCYSLYLFFDFAGYSLFATGISAWLGIATPANFNQPFKAKNIKDFWNRWHMSLSFWFRDYVFMRFTFLVMKHHWIKKRVHVAQFAYLANFLLMGFWHGVTWYYIVYGLFHAGAIITNDAWLRFKKRRHLPSNRLTTALAIFITFNVVCFSFLIFSGFLNTLWFHNTTIMK